MFTAWNWASSVPVAAAAVSLRSTRLGREAVTAAPLAGGQTIWLLEIFTPNGPGLRSQRDDATEASTQLMRCVPGLPGALSLACSWQLASDRVRAANAKQSRLCCVQAVWGSHGAWAISGCSDTPTQNPCRHSELGLRICKAWAGLRDAGHSEHCPPGCRRRRLLAEAWPPAPSVSLKTTPAQHFISCSKSTGTQSCNKRCTWPQVTRHSAAALPPASPAPLQYEFNTALCIYTLEQTRNGC